MVSSLLHGAETKVWGDTVYQGQTEAIRAADHQADFGFTHARYRGLAKNGKRFEVLCAFANLYIKRRVLMRCCHA